MSRKAQIQAISLVIISGIVISLAGAAYFWGKPLLDKRSTMTEVATAEAFIIQLDNLILDVARNGGEKSLNLPRVAGTSVTVNESENAIVFKFVTIQSFLAMGDNAAAVPIETQSLEPVGVYGESPRIITLESIPMESQYAMVLKMIYRELDTPDAGYKIVLKKQGTTGTDRITVSEGGKSVVTGGAANNDGNLMVTYVNVKVA